MGTLLFVLYSDLLLFIYYCIYLIEFSLIHCMDCDCYGHCLFIIIVTLLLPCDVVDYVTCILLRSLFYSVFIIYYYLITLEGLLFYLTD